VLAAWANRCWRSTEVFLDDSLPLPLRASWALGLAIFRYPREPVLAWQWAQQAADTFRRLGDVKRLIRALSVLAGARLVDSGDQQRIALHEMRQLSTPDLPALLNMHAAEAECLFAFHHGDLATVQAQLRRWMALAEGAGSEGDRRAAAINLADLALANGDAAEAVRLGLELEARWCNTRQLRSLATCRMNLMAALLAQGDLAQARAVAARGWPLASSFSLQQYWLDSLALLAALEGRLRTCVQLRICSDAAYALKNEKREVNEKRSADRADGIARAALGDAEFERLRGLEVTLNDERIEALAFATEDSP
jgi:hypothetical protein